MTKKSQVRNNLVVKGNDFINARHQLSVAEMRIVLTMIAQIGRDDVAFKPYRIYIKDFVDAVGTSHKGEYERAREITANLMKRVMEIPKENGYLQISFLSSAEYTRGTGYVELSFDPKLKPYLLQLKERFTQYDIRNVLSLQSFYSIRIYELLKQYIRLGERSMGIEELKELLKLPSSYNHYASFKRRIILQSQKDLAQHTDLSFEFEEIKTGRKITHIRFLIRSVGARSVEGVVEAGKTSVVEQAIVQDSPVNSPLLERLVEEFGLTRSLAAVALRTHSETYIEENLEVVVKRLEKGLVKDLTPYTLKALAEDFRKQETAAERKHREKRVMAERVRQEQEAAEREREQLLMGFEQARDGELARLILQISLNDLFEGFLDHLTVANKFALDFVKREMVKQGRPFNLIEHVNHALIEPTFKAFLTRKYLPDEYKTVEAWAATKRP